MDNQRERAIFGVTPLCALVKRQQKATLALIRELRTTPITVYDAVTLCIMLHPYSRDAQRGTLVCPDPDSIRLRVAQLREFESRCACGHLAFVLLG